MDFDPGRRPAYADYKKNCYDVKSGDRLYEIADWYLIIGGYIILLASCLAISWNNPFSEGSIQWIIFSVLAYAVPIICELLYRRFFLYKFARFHVRWDYGLGISEPASDTCDKWGDFLDTEENRKAGKRGRIAFIKLFAAALALIFLFCFLGCGLAYFRLYNWHREQIDEMVSIAENYKSLKLDGVNGDVIVENMDGTSAIAQGPDAEKLKQVFRSLSGEAVQLIYWDGKIFSIEMRSWFDWPCLICYPKGTDISHVKEDTHREHIIRMNDEWWYIW